MATHKEPTDREVEAEAAAIYPDTNPGAPTPEEIAREAHAIYLSRGAEPGHDVEDWLEAERRLKAARAESQRGGSWRERDANRRAHGGDDLKA
ncbi:MAG: DUF2934 domain-containing protein [Vicinamibacterales bacterium]